MKADFKGYGRAETLLEKHIPKYDNSLSPKMLLEANALEDQIQRFVISTEPESFTIKDLHGETAYWTISFTQPVIQYVPECFRFLTTNIRYRYISYSYLEHIPCYIPNINHVAMYVRYNNRVSEFGNNLDGLFRKHIFEKGQPMEFSSLNILLKWNSKPVYFDDSVQDYIKKSFEFCYWRLPTPSHQDDGSCINNLIYATTSRVLEVLMLRKTLVKILQIDSGRRKEERSVLERNCPGKFAEVLILCDDGEKIIPKKGRVFVLEHIVDSLKEGDVLNAVLVRVGTQKNSKRIMLIGKIGKLVKPDNFQCILSLILSKILQTFENDSSPTKIGTKNKIQFEVTKFIRENHSMFEGILGWGKDIPKKISKSIKELFPMFLEDGENVFQLSPVLMSFLASTAPQTLENKNSLVLHAKLFDTMKVNSNFWGPKAKMKLRTSDNYEKIQGDTPSLASQLIKVSPRLVNRMVYSRILSQHFTYWS